MRTRSYSLVALAGLAGLAAPLGLASAGAAVPAAGHHAKEPELRVIAVKGYGHVLGDAAGHSLYLLSAERGKKLVCKGACLKIWPPLLVPTRVKHVTFAKGVKGTIGFVPRSKTEKQVTLNGYPLFTFVGDKKPAEASGENITHFGGTWYLVRPTTKKVADTSVRPPHKKTPPTSTTSGYGSSGYGSSGY